MSSDSPSSSPPSAAPSRLELSAGQLAAVERHAAATYPEECCGFLVGSREVGSREVTRVVVERVEAADNQRADRRGDRFLIHPEIVLRAHRAARRDGLDVVGYYHSHPDHPAEPSDFDREHAWPGLSYLIVPVAAGEPGPARSWRLSDDRHRFDEETVAVVEGAGRREEGSP